MVKHTRDRARYKLFEGLFRPIVRVCLRYSIKLKDVIELLKNCWVRVAVEELSQNGGEVSISRIHVMTGISRVEIKRILEGTSKIGARPDIVSKVVGKWQLHADFTTKTGSPRILSVEGASSEFCQLVQSVSIDLNPYTVLFELERLDIVERTERGLKLKGSSVVSNRLDDALAMAASDIEDMLQTVIGNVETQQEEKSLHLKTEFDNIPAVYEDRIRTWLRRKGSIFHRSVRVFLAKHDRDTSDRLNQGGETIRVALGSFNRIEKIK